MSSDNFQNFNSALNSFLSDVKINTFLYDIKQDNSKEIFEINK